MIDLHTLMRCKPNSLAFIRDVQPFMQKHGLNYVSLISMNDQSCASILCTDMNFIIERFKRGLRMKGFNELILDRPVELIFWSDVADAADREINHSYGYVEGIGIIFRKKKVYHMVALGVDGQSPAPHSYFLNNKTEFIAYARALIKANSEVIEDAFRSCLVVPPPVRDVHYQRNFFDRKHQLIAGDVAASLTEKEMQILYYLAKGASVKVVSETMGLSPRTVESRLNEIRNKTGISERPALIAAFGAQFPDYHAVVY